MVPFEKRVREVAGFGSNCYEEKWVNTEPTSVLHMRSPSPPTSASTLSSFAGDAAFPPETPVGVREEIWASELPPVPIVTGWESLMSESPVGPELDQWVAGNVEEASFSELLQLQNRSFIDQEQIFSSGSNNFSLGSLPIGSGYHQFESPDEKPQILMSHVNPSFFMPSPFSDPKPQIKYQNSVSDQISKPPFPDLGHESFLRRLQHQNQNQDLGFSEMGQNQQEQALLDQIYKSAEQVGFGNFSHAQAILARLNHQLSPAVKPLRRAVLYFTEALQLLLATSTGPRAPAPFDVIFKMGAYKAFSEVSPMTHFVNFTCNQALLEAIGDAGRIHIFDFDIGFGAQWASFMQELPARNRCASSLKITAFVSLSTYHPVELELMRENLTQFANDIGLNFELEFINFDSLDQCALLLSSDDETVAVNFPVWSSAAQPSSFPDLIRIVKQLSPKIVVSLDRGCDRNDLSFPNHLIHALQSYIHLFESLDAVNTNPDIVNKIERFLIQPRIETTVLGRFRSPEKMPLSRTLFASAGFSPVSFSNFTETQAECVIRRTPARGFHVEKRQASLVLCWQGRELMSASAWRC